MKGKVLPSCPHDLNPLSQSKPFGLISIRSYSTSFVITTRKMKSYNEDYDDDGHECDDDDDDDGHERYDDDDEKSPPQP